MARTQTATCQDCGWQGPVEDTLEFRHLHERVLPGDVMPAGDCPEEGCGGAAMLDGEDDGEPDLRPALEALMLGLDRLHEAMCTDAPGGSVRARVKRLADSARTALAAGPPLQPICNTCGGTAVRVDAWASWDTPAQHWELHSTYDAAAICADCDVECSFTMKPVTGTA